MPANYSRPQPTYIVISRPNDKRYQLLTRNKQRPPTDFLIDLDFGYLIDVANELDAKIDGVSRGALPGVANPINFNKFLVPDGAGSSTWAFVSAANVLGGSLLGSNLAPQTITERELADGGIITSKIQQKAITMALLDDECVSSEKLEDEAVTRDKIASAAISSAEIEDGAVRDTELASGAVTFIKLAQDVKDYMNAIVPIAASIEWPGTQPPTSIGGLVDWKEENGQAISRATYASLFAIIGTTFGPGDGATTFNLPDKRGRVTVGIGSDNSTGGRITAATSPSIVLGGTFGAETHTLDVTQMPPHTHDVGAQQDSSSGVDFTGYTQVGATRILSTSTGGGLPHNNVQPSMFMRYYIRAL